MLNVGQFSMQIMRLSGSVFGANQQLADQGADGTRDPASLMDSSSQRRRIAWASLSGSRYSMRSVQIRLLVGGCAILECLHRGTLFGLFHACFAPSVEPKADINEVDALMPTV